MSHCKSLAQYFLFRCNLWVFERGIEIALVEKYKENLMGYIILKKHNNCIMSYNFTYDLKYCPVVMKAFGTHAVPTAYTEQADMNEVIADLRKLNPHHTIMTISDFIRDVISAE